MVFVRTCFDLDVAGVIKISQIKIVKEKSVLDTKHIYTLALLWFCNDVLFNCITMNLQYYMINVILKYNYLRF
jgi:hypothetical protein